MYININKNKSKKINIKWNIFCIIIWFKNFLMFIDRVEKELNKQFLFIFVIKQA